MIKYSYFLFSKHRESAWKWWVGSGTASVSASICLWQHKMYWYGIWTYFCTFSRVCASGTDPWHFCVDLDPRILASDKWIRMRIRILVFLSVTFKLATKIKFNKKISAFSKFCYRLEENTVRPWLLMDSRTCLTTLRRLIHIMKGIFFHFRAKIFAELSSCWDSSTMWHVLLRRCYTVFRKRAHDTF